MKKWILKCSMPLLLLTGLFYPKPYEASAASGSVSINETNFPDQIFREYIQSEFDTEQPYGKLSNSELQNVTEIGVRNKGITSLKGIEYFYALKWLDCSINQLTSLDVSNNTALGELDCSDNQLTSLDVSQNTKLLHLDCCHNHLTSLDLTDSTKKCLYLNCGHNNLTSLDLTNVRLVKFYCDDNKLTSIDLSKQDILNERTFVCRNYPLRVYAPDYKFDLSTLPGDFDVERADFSHYDYVTVDGTILTIKDAFVYPGAEYSLMYKYETKLWWHPHTYFEITIIGDAPDGTSITQTTPDLVITKQPTDVSAEYGELVKVPVKAIGKNPTYQWYVCSPTGSKFSKSSITTSTYTIRMNEAVDGRKIYCVITDDNDNTVTTKTVTLKSKVAITQQPTDTLVKIGSKASTTVHATGNGLKYQWYVKDPTSTTFKTSVITSETYSFQMTDSKSGRQVYCVITDKYGNTVTSNTVTLGGPVKITAQPTNASATIGSTVKTTVTATGVGLKYQWYFKNPTSTTFAKSSVTDATYSATMTESKSERQVYCVITDKNGNTKKTNTVTLTSKVKITQQPQDVVGESLTIVTTTVKATGNDLKYQWYVRDPDDKDWKTSSITTNEYSFVLIGSKYGRKVRCVITDKYGNQVTTRTVTFITPGFQVYCSKTNKDGGEIFYFHPSGALNLTTNIYSTFDESEDYPYYYSGVEDDKIVLNLKIRSDADWKVSASANYVIFRDTNGTLINSGTKGESWLIVYLDKFLSDSKEPTRECTITIESDGEKREYTLVQQNYQINGMTKEKYLASVDPAIKELTLCDTAMNYLKVKRITYGKVEYKSLTPTLWLGIYSRETSPDDIELEYIVFEMNADYNRTEEPADYTSEIYGYLRVKYVYGMKIVPNVDHMITTNFPIDSAAANSTDELHKAFEKYFETAKDHANETTDVLLEYFSWRLKIDIVGLEFIIGKVKEELIEDLFDNIIEGDDDDGYVVCKAPSKATILDECALSNVGNSIEVRNFTDTPDSNSAIYFSFDIVNSHNQKVTFDSGNVLSEDDQTWDVEDNK